MMDEEDLFTMISEILGPPCKYDKVECSAETDAIIQEWCDRFCGDATSAECWQHWLAAYMSK